jgi:NAD(P) transhydrogenase subunit alpha
LNKLKRVLKVEASLHVKRFKSDKPIFNCTEKQRRERPLSVNSKCCAQKIKIMLNWISENQQYIYIVILMIFLGIEVIGRVPSVLHTPLMSGASAIHGVVIIGAIIVMGKAESNNYVALILGFLAVILGTLNVVGGFVVTNRMLEMFKGKKEKKH